MGISEFFGTCWEYRRLSRFVGGGGIRECDRCLLFGVGCLFVLDGPFIVVAARSGRFFY